MVNKITADVTGKKVVAGPIEATAIGNIMVQLISLGDIADIGEGRRIVGESFDAIEYVPGEMTEEIKAAYEKFLTFV